MQNELLALSEYLWMLCAQEHRGFQRCSLYWDFSVTVVTEQTEAALYWWERVYYCILFPVVAWFERKRSTTPWTSCRVVVNFCCKAVKIVTFRPFKQRGSHLSFCLNVYLCCRCVARVSRRSWSVWAYWMLWIRTRTSPTSWPSSSENPASNWPKASKHTSPR